MNEPKIGLPLPGLGEYVMTYSQWSELRDMIDRALKEHSGDMIEYCRYKQKELENQLAEFKRLNPENIKWKSKRDEPA